MAMTKIIDPRGWDFDRPVAVMVKVSSRGLIGSDRDDFLKTASHVFLPFIDNIKVAKDEVPVHCIALGASEFVGPNRNGDGFKEATCRECHPTFVKYAKWYRDHRNKMAKGDPYYGYIKESAYNEDMHRVELLAILNGSKEAAERNGGEVADKEIEKLARGKDLDTSMSCRVSHDECSGCYNKARTRDEYCTSATCKRGGCRDNLTKIGEDGHILHVDNPSPLWFDNSTVYRHADRIANGARADWLDKAASHAFIPGAELADMLGVTTPLDVCIAAGDASCWGEHVAGQIKLAQALACVENTEPVSREAYRSFSPAVQPRFSASELAMLGTPGTEKSASALAALADQKIILSLQDFAAWQGKTAAYSTASQFLPSVYRRLATRDDIGHVITRSPFDLLHAKTASASTRVLAHGIADDFSFAPDAVSRRAMLSVLRGCPEPTLKDVFKTAADDPDAAKLADQYALYKLAALYRIADFDPTFSLTARLAIAQNRFVG